MSNDNLARIQNVPSDARLTRRIEKIRALLISEETMECYAAQSRVYALTNRRMVVACTSGRLLILKPNILPGHQLIDVRWQDLRDANLNEGIFGATLTIKTATVTHVLVGLKKGDAEAVYRFCQSQEQSWREKNRVRGMDEARALAGGVQIHTATTGGAGSADDLPARLTKLKSMKDSNLISDSDYETAKAKLLNAL